MLTKDFIVPSAVTKAAKCIKWFFLDMQSRKNLKELGLTFYKDMIKMQTTLVHKQATKYSKLQVLLMVWD